MIKVGSICSGIEAAIQAAPDNWDFSFSSEIDKFPSAVLAHHYPYLPNLGDFTSIKADDWKDVTLLCGGPPCQSFSIAGTRNGLDDERGNLTLDYVRMMHDFASNGLIWGLYENVPGILSDKTNAFGSFLSGVVGGDAPLCPPNAEWGEITDDDGNATGTHGWKSIRWPSQGMVEGPRARAAWDILDAQWFGLAQRRKRVFVVISFADDRDPAKVLFERKGVLGNTPPSRETGQGLAGNAMAGAGNGSDGRNNQISDSDVQSYRVEQKGYTASSFAKYTEGVGTLKASGGDLGGGSETLVAAARMVAFGEYEIDGTASTVKARDYKDATDLIAFSSKNHGQDASDNLSPVLRAGSHNKSHANAGVPPAIAFKPSHYTRGKDGKPSEIMPPLTADADKGDQEAVVLASAIGFNSRQDPVSGVISGGLDSYPTQAVAFAQNTRDEVRLQGGDGKISRALCADEGMKQRTYIAEPIPLNTQVILRDKKLGRSTGFGAGDSGDPAFTLQANHHHAVGLSYAVRRLTPTECERLQGFPDDFTQIPYRGKPPEDCPDGPRYKALGNSWAVPVVKWIFDRIELQEAALRDAG